jgi:hypothetical protein
VLHAFFSCLLLLAGAWLHTPLVLADHLDAREAALAVQEHVEGYDVLFDEVVGDGIYVGFYERGGFAVGEESPPFVGVAIGEAGISGERRSDHALLLAHLLAYSPRQLGRWLGPDPTIDGPAIARATAWAAWPGPDEGVPTYTFVVAFLSGDGVAAIMMMGTDRDQTMEATAALARVIADRLALLSAREGFVLS